ncbi:MAG: PorT family protein [Bacteroidales bacterium]|jgi:hypothetical protein|nr:PorT family protein [Bacteroidales bacterium]
MNRKIIIYFLSIFILIISINDTYAQRRNKAPKNRFGIRAGFNMSDLTSAAGLDVFNGLAFYDANKNYVGFTDTKPFQYGFNVGAIGQIQISDSWFIQPSFIFTTKGYKLNTQNQNMEFQNVELDVNAYYIQIPIDVVWKFSFNEDFRFFAQGGVFLGLGVGGKSNFIDHYGEKIIPRPQHETTPFPTDVNGFIGYDPTVHGLLYADRDETFKTEGTNKWELGLEIGLGFEYKSFQLMLSYQYGFIGLYDYNYDFTTRYEAKGQKGINNSFQYLRQEAPKSPSLHTISISLAYYMDFLSNKIRY